MEKKQRTKFKLKVLLYLGYIGSKYHGLQIQKFYKDVPTIEKELLKALLDADLIKQNENDELKKNKWTRGARTDTGVHALVNAITVQFELGKEYFISSTQQYQQKNVEDEIQQQVILNQQEKFEITQQINDKDDNNIQIKEQIYQDQIQIQEQIIQKPLSKKKQRKLIAQQEFKQKQDQRNKIDKNKILAIINSNLPDDIKFYGFRQINKSFNSRRNGKSRTYSYLIPSQLFIKNKDLHEIFQQNKGKILPEIFKIVQQKEQENKQVSLDKIDFTKLLQKINGFCHLFLGFHKFHNYSIKINPNSQQAIRKIQNFNAEIIEDQNYKEPFFKFTIQGNSFIYHQIRKMIGVLVMIQQLDLDEKYIQQSFKEKEKVPVWLAPCEGLFLNQIEFFQKNSQINMSHSEDLTFQQDELIQIENFKQKIIDEIIEKKKEFPQWLVRMFNIYYYHRDDDQKNNNLNQAFDEEDCDDYNMSSDENEKSSE